VPIVGTLFSSVANLSSGYTSDCNQVLSQAFCRGVILDQLSINKATVSLSVAFVTAGDTASVSELSNNPLFTALNACTVESLIAHLGISCDGS
jgi:hypothetical protein